MCVCMYATLCLRWYVMPNMYDMCALGMYVCYVRYMQVMRVRYVGMRIKYECNVCQLCMYVRVYVFYVLCVSIRMYVGCVLYVVYACMYKCVVVYGMYVLQVTFVMQVMYCMFVRNV